MKSYSQIAAHPASLPLTADDIVEFHLARILLLLRVCGIKNQIIGLTKFAKLDFFVRYPGFYTRARDAASLSDGDDAPPNKSKNSVESAMVRHHYGPWDKRYYHILAHLAAKGLVTVAKEGNAYRIALTEVGKNRADALKKEVSFEDLITHMKHVRKAFGGKKGNFLKELIYKTFREEVADRSLGESIDL